VDERERALERAHAHTRSWLKSLQDRPVTPRASVEEIAERLGRTLPAQPSAADAVVDLLADACEPGLTAMPSGRFFGFVIGGGHPAALAADWLTSAWDQSAIMRQVTPAHSAVEDIARDWVLDLLGLPAESAMGFVTGATMSNFTCLAAARESLLRRAGWDTPTQGLYGAPRIRVLVGKERHDTVDLVLRYLGMGSPEPVAADEQGRIEVSSLAEALEAGAGQPTIVVLQAGNVHSGAFDDFGPAIEVAHRHGAWVHVDGAFGLFAAASPTTRHLMQGCAAADSWTTDAHKTLNVPYDCGIAIVRDRADLSSAMSFSGDYLIKDQAGDPLETVPESSRRARALPVWAVLRSLGRLGVADLIDGFCRHAGALAEGIAAIDGAEILNQVDFTQVCVSFGSDERTQEVLQRVMADGTTWMSGSRWHDRAVMRISVSNWCTTDDDVQRSLSAVRRACES
jgi:glutamate/tyrosine decarboxylase-like PLP-dependent enzyme